MTRAEWHRDRMEQERNEDAQVEAREREAIMRVIEASILLAWYEMTNPTIPCRTPLGSDGAW